MTLAPIILFTYNRPELFRQTLESLAANHLASESELFIFADGPKESAGGDQLKRIAEVQRIASERKWCGQVNITREEKNKGLAKSVIDGVSKIMKDYEKVIVIEDDVLLSPFFLEYMNEALQTYSNSPQIIAVGSWTYFTRRDFKNQPFFFRYPDSIAWGTFRRSWSKFESDGKEIFRKLNERKLLERFNGFRNLEYFSPMLLAQIDGKIDSWAIRWTATAILQGGLTIFPPVSMSKHMGFTADGTHEKTTDYNADLPLAREPVGSWPKDILESTGAFHDWKNFIRGRFLSGNSKKKKIINYIREILPVSVHKIFFS